MPCPKCGGRLRYQGKRKNTGRKLVCSNRNCDYKRYVSPKPGMQEDFRILRRIRRLLRGPGDTLD